MQATSDKTASANFTQTGFTISPLRYSAGNVTNGKTGYQPYYQWGRKDAFRSHEYTAEPAANTSLIYSATSVTVGTTIKNPMTHYNDGENITSGKPCTPVYYNAWNATFTTYSNATTKIDGLEKVVKTVYDPCPVGYTVPPANTFTAFTNSNMPVDGKGRKYTIGGKALYFPSLSGRQNNTGKAESENAGQYWVAVSASAAVARRLAFDVNNALHAAHTDGYSARSYSYTIRPVREN